MHLSVEPRFTIQANKNIHGTKVQNRTSLMRYLMSINHHHIITSAITDIQKPSYHWQTEVYSDFYCSQLNVLNVRDSMKSAFLHLSVLVPPAAHPRLIPCPPLISCGLDEWRTNVDQTQTRQQHPHPISSFPIPFYCFSLICPPSFSCLYLFLSHPIFLYYHFFLYSLSFILSPEWIKHM